METEIAAGRSAVDAAERVVSELFMTSEGRTDPYPRYDQLRQLAPIHRSGLGFWFLSRHDDCAMLLEDTRLIKDYARQNDRRIGPQWREHVSLSAGVGSMVNLDGPEHARLRRLTSKAFTRRTIDALRPGIAATVDALLETIAEVGTTDLLEALAFPLALGVIGEIVGVPKSDLGQFPQLVSDLLAAFEIRPTFKQLSKADQAQLTLREYFVDLISKKRRGPGQDLLSALIAVDEGDDCLTDEELWRLAILLFGAGFETTANQIGNGILALLRHPDELDRLRTDDTLSRLFPDELLRYDSTVQMTVRATAAAVTISGVEIPAGETVLVLLGAGNRDPSRYAQADRLDLTRTNVRPLAFGGGVHYCLGAALARVELEIAIRALLRRFKEIELAATPRFRDRLTMRGLEALDVTCRS